jgi:uncharacterized membrane protein YfcA
MLLLILIGIISGIITGITGLQIGILIPSLIISGIIPNLNTAIGTTLYAFLPPTALLSVFYLYKQGHVDIQKGNVLIVVLLLSILIGSIISTYLSKRTISLLLSMVLFVTSIYFFIFSYNS